MVRRFNSSCQLQIAVEGESHCLKRRRVDITGHKLGENFALDGLLSDAECPLLAQSGHRVEALAIGYGALQATIASGRVRLATEGGAKIAT